MSESSPRACAPSADVHEPTPFDEQIEHWFQEGRAAWPKVELSRGTFAAYVEARAPLPEGAGGEILGFHPVDLYLACGCAQRDPAALAAFDAAFLVPLAHTLAFMRPAPAFVDDVRQDVREKLFVEAPGAPLKISAYSGRGSLSSWVGVVARRAALGLVRARPAQPCPSAAPRVATSDPEVDYLRNEYLADFREAFRGALASLTDRERVLLRLTLRGVTLQAVAVMYQVNPSTVSRWLACTRSALQQDVLRRVEQRLRLNPPELASLFRVLRSDLDLSLSRLLDESQPC